MRLGARQGAGSGATQLAERIAQGDLRALARGVTLVEDDAPQARALLAALYRRTGRTHVCGVTGPPGAGKSTLVRRLSVSLRQRGKRVAIIAVDPSSPFTGGALLGDRIRMNDALNDPGVFMRSLANRGQVGGLSCATFDTVSLIDAAGFDVTLIETVGAGQSEIEVMRIAHTTIVVAVPGLGDDVQAEKAGMMEIADIFVVNKADRDGADRVVNDIERMIGLAHMGRPGLNRWDEKDLRASRAMALAGQAHLVRRFGSAAPGGLSWRPPVIAAVAKEDAGIGAIVDRIVSHSDFLQESGRWESGMRLRAEGRVREWVRELAADVFFDTPRADGCIDDLLRAVTERRLDPHAAARRLIDAGDAGGRSAEAMP